MTPLLDSPTLRARVQPMTVEMYEHLGATGYLPKNVELLRGFIVTKMSKSPLHSVVARTLQRMLAASVPGGYDVLREDPLALADSEPEPDVAVVKGRTADFAKAHPTMAELVVEVAVSSLAEDEEKGVLYAEAGIPEFWLVRPEDRVVDVYREPAAAGYGRKFTVREGEVLRCAGIAGVEFAVSAIFPND